MTTVSVTGLKGITYKDKVLQGAHVVEERDDVTIASEVDRVYANVPGTVTVKDGGKTLFTVERQNLKDVVVWNPWVGSSGMSDFGPVMGIRT